MQLKATLKGVQYNPKSNFNLFSIGKASKEGWKLSGDQEGLVLTKGNEKLVFDIKITNENGVIFCAYLQREYETAVILASTGLTMSIEKAHMMTKHHDEELLNPESDKATRAGKRIFSDLVTIKAPQDSGITITKKELIHCHESVHGIQGVRVLQYQELLCGPICKTFSEWKHSGKLVLYIQHDNAPENKVSIKLANDLQWRLSMIAEYTDKGMPQRNQVAERGFTDVVDKARAMMVLANLPEEIKYKLCKECLNCAKYLSNQAAVALNVKKDTMYEHFHEAKPHDAIHFRI